MILHFILHFPLDRGSTDSAALGIDEGGVPSVQVVWVVEGEQGVAVTLSHKEFRREEEAMAFYEQLGEVL